MNNRKNPTQKTTDISRNACHADIAEDCLQDKTSDEETVTKLQTKRDFRDMLEHCHPTLDNTSLPHAANTNLIVALMSKMNAFLRTQLVLNF
jgi:hypothetical protein